MHIARLPWAPSRCHAPSPDFRERDGGALSRDEAASALAHAYANVLSVAATVAQKTLRLLPLSSGIIAGRFAEQMPALTAEALAAAWQRLPEPARRELCARRVELCVYAGGSEASSF